jgi:hypothetical protein
MAKVISPEVQRNGCQHYEQKIKTEGSELIKLIMNKFEGELI